MKIEIVKLLYSLSDQSQNNTLNSFLIHLVYDDKLNVRKAAIDSIKKLASKYKNPTVVLEIFTKLSSFFNKLKKIGRNEFCAFNWPILASKSLISQQIKNPHLKKSSLMPTTIH